MLAAFGGILLLLSSLNAILGTVVGTCTMDSADDLVIALLMSAIVCTVGVACLIARPPSTRGWVLLSPVIGALAYQTYLACSFFIAYHVHSVSACTWMKGTEYEADGREPWLTVLWLGASVLVWAGLAAAWFRGHKSRRVYGE
jgi:hypothetical protein